MDKGQALKKYAFIDALRGWAIIGVIFVHASHWFPPTSQALGEFASQGARGVQLFFLASALTLFISLDFRRSHEHHPALNFFIRRFFRIAPLFYLGIVFYFLYFGTEAHFWRPNGFEWWHIAATAGFIHGLHPETFNSIVPGGWSIGVEFVFYLFVPLLFLAIRNLRHALIATMVALVGSILVCKGIEIGVKSIYPENQHYLIESFIFMSLASQLPIFAFGVLNFYLIKTFPDKGDKTKMLMLAAALFSAIIFSVLLYLSDIVAVHVVFGPLFLGFSMFLYYCPIKLFVNRVVKVVGTLSFSMYLTHFVVLYTMDKVFPSGFGVNGDIDFFIAFILILCFTTVLSFFTYSFVEKPGVRLGKVIVRRLEAKSAGGSSPSALA